MTKDSKAKIRKVLNAIRPALALHAGDVELVDFEKKSGATALLILFSGEFSFWIFFNAEINP